MQGKSATFQSDTAYASAHFSNTRAMKKKNRQSCENSSVAVLWAIECRGLPRPAVVTHRQMTKERNQKSTNRCISRDPFGRHAGKLRCRSSRSCPYRSCSRQLSSHRHPSRILGPLPLLHPFHMSVLFIRKTHRGFFSGVSC